MLSVHCPECGGTNIFEETENIPTFCGFCGANLPDMTQFVKDALKVEVNRKQLELDKQRHKMKMEAADRELQKAEIKSIEQKAQIAKYISMGFALFIMLVIVILTFVMIAK